MRSTKPFSCKARVNSHKGAKGESHEDTAQVVLREIPHPRGHQRKEPGERQAERSGKHRDPPEMVRKNSRHKAARHIEKRNDRNRYRRGRSRHPDFMARDGCRLGNNHHPREGPAEKQRDHGVKDRAPQHFAPGEPFRLCFRFFHHAVRHEIRRTLPADKPTGHDGNPTDRSENNERRGNADSANQSLSNRRHKHRTHAIGRRHDTPCHPASVREITDSGSDAGPIGQPQTQTEKTAVRRNQSPHGFRETAADQP